MGGTRATFRVPASAVNRSGARMRGDGLCLALMTTARPPRPNPRFAGRYRRGTRPCGQVPRPVGRSQPLTVMVELPLLW